MNDPNTCYILSLSYGKDSIASIEACKQLGWRIDRIVHAEVWATQDIPADLPPMVEFKKYADKIIKERYGIEVEHICATKKCSQNVKVERERERESCVSHTKTSSTQSDSTEKGLKKSSTDSPVSSIRGVTQDSKLMSLEKLTYEDIFYRPIKNSKSKIAGGGESTDSRYSKLLSATHPSNSKSCKIYGFPGIASIGRSQWCTGELKTNYLRIPGQKQSLVSQAQKQRGFSDKPLERGVDINIVQYLGIASDEPKRIERHQKKDGILLPLVEIGWDEAYCRKWCEENDLLSPIYTTSARGGCWFCHNQGVEQLRLLRKNYPDLWKLLLKWDSDSPVTFHPDGHTVHDFDKRFEYEELYAIPTDRKFRWKMLDEPQLKFKE